MDEIATTTEMEAVTTGIQIAMDLPPLARRRPLACAAVKRIAISAEYLPEPFFHHFILVKKTEAPWLRRLGSCVRRPQACEWWI